MITAEQYYHDMIDSVSREIRARVELLDGSTLLNTFTYDGALQSFTVERMGDSSKFFGFGICKKLTLKLRDKERTINITKGQRLDVAIGVGCDYLYTFPIFFVDEVTRDENTNALTITAYDAIYKANGYTVKDIKLPQSYSIFSFAAAAAALLGMPIKLDIRTQIGFDASYPNGANFDGTESVREALDDVAEATGTIYFVNNNWELVFKTLDISGDPVLTIDKSKYFTLSAKTKYMLTGITHSTELGDNVTADINVAGAHQYLRENAFLTNRDDVGALVNNIFTKVQQLTMYQFDLKWRGNFLLEIGDKIRIVNKDDTTIDCYAINDTITYNGGLVENTSWEYNESQHENASNPSTIGEALKKATARVDKISGEIILKVEDMDTKVSQLQVTSDNIAATIEQNAINTDNKIDSLEQNIDMVSNKVEATMTSDQVELLVNKTISNGVNHVETSTGFTFDEHGLSVTKSNSEISTTITEDGMQVFKSDTALLTANNQGVAATNLRSNYIIIGNRCRLEKYGADRVGCYWLGG